MTLHGLGVQDSPNTTGWPPRVFQGFPAPMDQGSKSRTKNNFQAKHRTTQMPSAGRHRKTSQCLQVMFKANKHIYKKHGISNLTMRG